MTEADWLGCADPRMMVEFVEGRASERKLRLLTIAAAGTLWQYIPEAELQGTIEAAERCADGLMTDGELRLLTDSVYSNFVSPVRFDPERPAQWQDGSNPKLSGVLLVLAARYSAKQLARLSQGFCWRSGVTGVITVLPELIRDIFGNPFRPITFDPSWRTSNVIGHASAIYAEREFDRLPILADALEDAGCDQPDLLAHCRSDGPHVRGCWAIDLILGKS